MDVTGWLRDLGFERSAQAFRENAIDADRFPNLMADDLEDLGVAIAGHRRRMLDAVETPRAHHPVDGRDHAAEIAGSSRVPGGRPPLEIRDALDCVPGV